MARNVKSHPGTTLLETVIAVALLAAALSLSTQVLAWTAMERRESQRRQVALQEAANCLERLRGWPSDRLSTEQAQAIALSPQAHDVLPQGRVAVDIRTDPADENSRQIQIEVHWSNRTGQPLAPVRLTTWRWNVD